MIGKIAVFCKNMLDWFRSERCFVNPFIKAFPMANNLLLITLVLCLATFNALYLAVSVQFGVNILICVLVLALLSSAFVAGFCNIVKDTVQKKTDEEEFERLDVKATFESFCSGIGQRYLPFFLGFIFFFFILIFGMMSSLLIATKYICPLSSIGLDIDSLQLVLANQNAMAEFASHMTKSQVIKMLELFYITNIITPGIIGYFLLLWIPEFMHTKKNVILSLFTSVKKLFSDFWNTICIYLIIVFGHIFIAFVFALLPQTSLMLYLSSLVFIYWVIYNVFAIFIYYRTKWDYDIVPAEIVDSEAEEQKND